jgi:small GTP-binding protein
MRKTRAKVIVVGDHAVGKTSLVHNFVHEGQNFNREYKMTTGIDIQSKIVTIESVRKDIELFFFDCSGHPMYRSLVAESIKDANYCVVCFSMTSEESFKSVTNWHEIIKKSNGGKDVKGIFYYFPFSQTFSKWNIYFNK